MKRLPRIPFHCLWLIAAFLPPVTTLRAEPPPAIAPFSAEKGAEFQKQWAAATGVERVLTNSIGMKLMLLPPGEFTMGRTMEQFDELLAQFEADPAMRKHRGGTIAWSMLMMPAHRVRITKPFYMGAHEVTVDQFRQFIEESGYKTEAEQGLNHGKPYKGGRAMSTWRKPMAWRKNYKQADDEPVLQLGWVDCVAFCKWLSEKEGVEYGMPTEAEWEYGCRAGTTTPWHFGGPDDFEKVAHDYAWWSDGAQGKHQTPRSVGKGKPNAFGLYDMHGNIWEYTADWWHRLSYKESPLNDPAGPAVQSEKGDQRRIIRGSSFDWGRWGGDAAYRMRITQRSNQHPHMGFRVVRRIKGAKGLPPAVDPDAEKRKTVRDPGADSPEVKTALASDLQEADFAGELTIDLGNGVKMEFVLIPAGSFLMGSDQGPKDERPVHRVVISKPFYMAKHELTQSQWEAVMGEDTRLNANESPDNDMTGPMKAMNALSWNRCRDYIAKLKKKVPGHAFALPTEAQWEYACRAGSRTEYHFANDPATLGDYAWFQGNAIWPNMPAYEGRTQYHDTGVKKPNAWGLHDMHGGVWEWCADRYDPDYYFTSPLADPAGPDSGQLRVLRGGSWFRYAKYARSAYRRFFHPESDSDAVTAWVLDFGCRLVINPGEASKTAAKPQAEKNVDYTALARSLVRHPGNPVIKVGKKGTWDDQTLGCLSVLEDGGKYFFYSGGTQYDQPKKIGMATSTDGIKWTKFEKNPLFPGSMPYAIKVGDTFRLYHPGKDESGRHGLLMKTSADAFNWSKPQRVLPVGILDPCVIRVSDSQFHLYYCAGGKKKKDGKDAWEFKNYMAISEDGIKWKKRAAPILPLGGAGDWDSLSHAGPCVLKLNDGFHLWYLGSGEYRGKTAWRIGHATSPDGISWTRSGDQPVLDVGPEGAWDGGTLMSFDILFRDGKFLFWYAGAPGGHGDESKMTIQVGHGTSR